MNIGIIFAMECERDAFLKVYKDSAHQITTYVCGIGKVNAACTTTKAIIEDDLDLVINCGIAGGINDARQFDVYYATAVKYSDVDVTMFDYELGQIPGMPEVYFCVENRFDLKEAKLGKIASQDTFATHEYKNFYKEEYSDYIAIDMESCAIAQTCYTLNKDFIAIRAISDDIFTPNNHMAFKDAEVIACEAAAKTLVELLPQI